MTSLLSVRDLNVKFHTQGSLLHAVRGIDFNLYPEETLGIVGESGCGKSATAKALLQLNPRHTTELSGEILYKERNLATLSEKQMQAVRGKEIGMIFQDPMTALNPTMKIGSQIVEGYLRHYRDHSREKAREVALQMLEDVGIPHREARFDAYPHTLSGGMRQRAMIALALACQPQILLADEPTTALDVTIQIQILELLKNIQKKMKMSILLITHDMGVIAHMCDRVLVMYAGKIVESAPVEKLFASPQHPYTQRLLQAIPRIDQNRNEPLIPIEGTPPNLSHPLKGCGFSARCASAMRICTQTCPTLYTVGEEHHAACFNHDPRRQKCLLP